MKGKKGMNLFAVIAAVIFLLVYSVPTLRNAANVETCWEKGGKWNSVEKTCDASDAGSVN